MFAPSPQTQVENNLGDEMSVCITKESKKGGSNYSVVINKQRIGSNYSDFIESTTKDSPCGSERQRGENNHLCHPDKQKCEFNCPNLAEIQKDESNDYNSVTDHNNNSGKVRPRHENNSGQVIFPRGVIGISHK